MSKQKIFYFTNSDVLIENELDDDINLHVTQVVDSDGQEITKEERLTIIVNMDNHQAYELAMEILTKIIVYDARR